TDDTWIENEHALANDFADKFKGFLKFEFWLARSITDIVFTIHLSQKCGKELAHKLNQEDLKINIEELQITRKLNYGKSAATPPAMTPLFDITDPTKAAITLVGLEISTIYIDAGTGGEYPLILRELRSQFSKAIKKSFFEFIRFHSS